MARDFWFKFYFKDWANDTRPLSLSAKGLLIELLIFMHEHNGEVENDLKLISRLSGGLTDGLTENITELRNFAILDFEKRGDKEYLVSRKIKKKLLQSIVNKDNGLKGGNPRLTESVNRNSTEGVIRTSNSNSISNFDFNSNKGGMGENSLDQFFKEFETGSDIERVAMDFKMPLERIRAYLSDFRTSSEVSYPSYSKFVFHFKNWLRKQIQLEKKKELDYESSAARKLRLHLEAGEEVSKMYKQQADNE